jgi:predicted O-methyltransferase YrrM
MNEINLTRRSQEKVKNIVENMEGRTFHHHFHVLYDIISSIKKDVVTYLEIGSYCGASCSLVLSHPKIIKAFCIDTFGEASTELVSNNLEKFKTPHSSYSLIVGNSQNSDTIQETKNIVNNVDLLYIDGDHSFEGCMNDFLNYSDIVQSGGYVVFDDYHDVHYSPQVKHAVDYIVSDLLFDQYEVIGSFRNSLKTYPSEMIYNNEFILRKK